MEMVDIHWDRDIDRREIQQLSNADAITAFFARLGYNTDARIEHTPATLRIDAQGVIRPIEAIERIANHDDALQVMLFVVKSVTVSHTRSLPASSATGTGISCLCSPRPITTAWILCCSNGTTPSRSPNRDQ